LVLPDQRHKLIKQPVSFGRGCLLQDALDVLDEAVDLGVVAPARGV
jgi:hypothetical protein